MKIIKSFQAFINEGLDVGNKLKNELVSKLKEHGISHKKIIKWTEKTDGGADLGGGYYIIASTYNEKPWCLSLEKNKKIKFFTPRATVDEAIADYKKTISAPDGHRTRKVLEV